MGGSSINISSITAVVMMVCMFISMQKGHDYIYNDVKAICMMGVLTALEAIFEVISNILDHRVAFAWMNGLVNSCEFIMNVGIGYAWVCFVYIKIYGTIRRVSRKQLAIVAVPGIIVILLSIVNLLTPVFYRINAAGIYERAEHYIWAELVAGFYMLYGLVLFELKSRQIQRYTFYPVLSFLLPVLIYQIIQLVFDSLSLTSIGVAVGTVTLYLSFKNEAACIDFLSGVYNRQYFERYLEDAVKRPKPGMYLCGIMIDIDRFKRINDTYGHLVGNEAICDAAGILNTAKRNLPGRIHVFRYGGDEFSLIQWVKSKEEANEIIRELHRVSEQFNESKVKPYEIHLSAGYAFFEKGDDSVYEFVTRMDEEMYQNKQAKRRAEAAAAAVSTDAV